MKLLSLFSFAALLACGTTLTVQRHLSHPMHVNHHSRPEEDSDESNSQSSQPIHVNHHSRPQEDSDESNSESSRDQFVEMSASQPQKPHHKGKSPPSHHKHHREEEEEDEESQSQSQSQSQSRPPPKKKLHHRVRTVEDSSSSAPPPQAAPVQTTATTQPPVGASVVGAPGAGNQQAMAALMGQPAVQNVLSEVLKKVQQDPQWAAQLQKLQGMMSSQGGMQQMMTQFMAKSNTMLAKLQSGGGAPPPPNMPAMQRQPQQPQQQQQPGYLDFNNQPINTNVVPQAPQMPDGTNSWQQYGSDQPLPAAANANPMAAPPKGDWVVEPGQGQTGAFSNGPGAASNASPASPPGTALSLLDEQDVVEMQPSDQSAEDLGLLMGIETE